MMKKVWLRSYADVVKEDIFDELLSPFESSEKDGDLGGKNTGSPQVNQSRVDEDHLGEPGDYVINPKSNFPYIKVNELRKPINKESRKEHTYSEKKKNGQSPKRSFVILSSDSETEVFHDELPVIERPKKRRSSQSLSSESLVPNNGESMDINSSKVELDPDVVLLSDDSSEEFEEKKSPNMTHYMEDLNLPIHELGRNRGIETKNILNSVLCQSSSSRQVCQRMPLGVNKNLTFLINLDRFNNEKDILCDGNGTWTQTSTKVKYFRRTVSECETSNEQCYGESAFIKTRRMSYKHSVAPDFHRIIVFIWLHNGVHEELHNIALLQYFFEGEEHTIKVPPHGNSKTNAPFHRTCESTKMAIKKQINSEKFVSPKNTVHGILKERGGIDNIQLPGEHVRDRKQVSNFSYSERSSDPVLELMELCKSQSCIPESVFVREVTTSPELSVFLASEQQLLDLKRFCTSPKEFCVLGVDATFNVGQYYLTLTTYRNLLLSNKAGCHPVFLGPALIHQRRLFDSYFQLPSCILKYCADLKNLIVYGSDGEKNITDSFDTCFPGAMHLLCDIHMRDNIKSKLASLDINTDTSKLYLEDIFGKQIGQIKKPGLVDCESHNCFEEKVSSLKTDWVARHPNGEEFLHYFLTYKSELIKNSMTADIRAMSGLGFPPQMFNQNANECMNSVIKRELKWKRLNPLESVKHLQHIVERQFEEAKMAIIGRGEYRICEKYLEYKIDEVRYYQMTKTQKEKHEKRFFLAETKDDTEGNGNTNSFSEESVHNLSVLPEKSRITNVPFQILKQIFNKAAVLKNSSDSIVKAPIPNAETYYVSSTSNSNVPHMINVKSTGAVDCDNNCMHFATFKVCSHVLAVADKLEVLQKFLNWYQKKKVAPNLSALANSNLPNNRGKKPVKSTQKRKGGDPNQRRPEILELTSSTIPINEKPALPCPQTGIYSITLLKYCHVNTTTCYGCKGNFRKDGTPNSPGDLIIVTKGQREYKQGGEIKLSKPTNIYFHFNEKCVKNYDTCFIPCLARVMEDIKSHLNEDHKRVLEAVNIVL